METLSQSVRERMSQIQVLWSFQLHLPRYCWRRKDFHRRGNARVVSPGRLLPLVPFDPQVLIVGLIGLLPSERFVTIASWRNWIGRWTEYIVSCSQKLALVVSKR